MGLSVVTNTGAMNTHRNLSLTSTAVARSLERLSSGQRINRAADDAAGLAISEDLRAQVGGFTQAVRNTRDGVSVLQIAEGALAETTSILQRMRDLAVQAANRGGLDGRATAAVQTELDQLQGELTRIARTTTYNGTALLDGTYRGTFQVGPDAGDTITVPISRALDATGLGLAGVNLAAVVDPATVGRFPAQGRIDRIDTGRLVFVGATVTPGAIEALTGTLTYGGQTLDMGGMTYTTTDPGGVVSVAERVAQLNAAAQQAGITHRPDPFVDDGDDLIFRGAEPLPTTSDADLVELSPSYSAPPPGSTPAVQVDVLRVPASTSIPPRSGVLTFPGITAADLPTVRGTVSVDGRTFDLDSVSYTDTDGDGAVSGAEALAQLNAAARAAGVTPADPAFVESRFLTLSDVEFVDHGMSLQFRGPVPADGATPDELRNLSPVFAPGRDLITEIDAAIGIVSSQRAELGAVQNRFEHTLARLGVAGENAVASMSRIRDADVAAETTALARNQILLQAGTAMLAQANQGPQNVLRLLQG